MTPHPMRPAENGTALLLLLLLLLPLAMVFGSLAMAMHGRDSRLVDEIAGERCFWAAEAGIDDAIHKAGAALLPLDTPVTTDIGEGLSFEVTAINIGTDREDNDDDRLVDEPDEDLIEIHSIGRYRGIEREVATWLGRTSFLPPINSAVTITSPATDIDLRGAVRLNGNNYNLNGGLGDPTQSQVGISIMAPGTVGQLSSHLSGTESGKVLGTGGTPSLGTGPAFDVGGLAAAARNAANLVLTNGSYSGFSFGNAASGVGFVTYREGDVRFSGNTQGAGILVVNGNLTLTGRFRFDGLVVVLGSLEAGAGTALINGALVMGPTSALVRGVGTFDVRYSAEALRFANTLAGRYVTFNGWQELAR